MSSTEDRIEHLARRRAAAKMGWFVHAGVYVAVNAMLALLATVGGHHWAVYPAMGWGLGLAVHGIVVFLVTGGGGMQERLVESERRKLQAAQEPW